MRNNISCLTKRCVGVRKLLKLKPTKKKAFLASTAFVGSGVLAYVTDGIDYRQGRIVRQRERFDSEKHIRDIGEQLFHRLYRVTISHLKLLCELITPHLNRRKKRTRGLAPAVSVEVMLFIKLRLLAGASYLYIGWPYGVGKNTPYAIFDETLKVLNQNLPRMSFPSTEEECRFRADQFQQKRRSPINGIIAALDGIAIAITQPRLSDTPDPRKYYNRKGFYSISVQAAVSANYNFLFVSARHAGATHDSTAYRSSLLSNLLEGNELPTWVRVAADDAYFNGGRLLTPYSSHNLSQTQDAFNFYLSSCRMTVEQSFGILVGRFGIFWSPLRYQISKSTLIILVAHKLHNFILDNSETGRFTNVGMAEENEVQGCPVVYLQDTLHTEQDNQRARQRGRDSSTERYFIASGLQALGCIRPRPYPRKL